MYTPSPSYQLILDTLTEKNRKGFATGGTYKDYVSRGEEYKDLTFEEWLQEDKPGYKPSEFGRTDKATGGRIGLMSGATPKVQAMLDLITPVRQKYIDLKEAQINDPKGGTLKNFLNYENFLIKEIDSVKNTADAKKLISSTRYYLDQPEKLATSRKKLLDKLIEIENEKPGRATPGYKLALQAGYVMKKTKRGKTKNTTAPSGSFKNLLTIEDKKINRIDEVIRQIDSGQLTIDDILKEGSLTRYINKPFGFKNPESFSILIRKNKKYADRLDEFKLLNNVSFLNKYKGRDILAADASNVFEQARTGGKNFSQVAQSGPVKKILEFADRHIKSGGELVRKIDNNTFVYNNKIFSTTPDSVDQKVLNKLGLKNKKIIDLAVDASKQPEFKEIFDTFDKLREYETMERTHPVTGKKTPLTKLLQEADYIAGGRDRFGAKNIFSRTPFEIDHFGSVKDNPFKNIRIIPRTINQAAGNIRPRGVSTFKDMKQAEDFIGYNFTGDPLQSIINYINTEITKGQDPNYKGRATKIFSAKTKAIDKALMEAGQMGTRGGQILTPTFPEGVFTDQLSSTRNKRFKKSFTDVPILQRTTGDKFTIGSRPVTEKEIISVAERDAMEQRLKDRLSKNISEKTNVPIEEVGKDLTNVQKVIRNMQNQMNSGMDPKLLIEYLGAEMKDIAAFGQKYGGSVLGTVGRGLTGVDLPIFQVMFGSMYDIEQDSPLWLTIPAAFTDEVSNIFGLYNKSQGRFGLGKAKDFGKFLASSFVPQTFRSPLFKAMSKVGKTGTIAAPLLEAAVEAYRFEKMKDARDEAIRQFKIPEEKGIKGFENYIRSTIPQDLAGQGLDELTVPDSPGLPGLIRDLKELGSLLNLSDDPYEIKKIRGDVTGTGLTSPMALQRLYDRQGLVEGGPPDKKRRMILKMLGLIPAGIAGLASLRFGPKKVKKVIDTIKTTEVPGKPEWFDSLVNKVIRLGEDVSKKFATQDRQVVHRVLIDKDGNVIDANQADKIRQEGSPYDVEDITVTRNLDDGEIRVTYYSDENMGAGDVDLVYKPGQADEYTKGTPPDTFEAVEGEPRVVNFDGDIEYDGENLVNNINDLYSDTNKLKQFATDQKPTMKEFIESKKKKAIVEEVNRSDVGATEYLSNKYGEPLYDLPDEDPPEFASGGIANFFKKR